jgi:acyl-CoA synthetase (AMP-forming)/AMP-acid ligase II
LPLLREVIVLDDWQAFLAGAANVTLPRVRPLDIAQIQYTSGTTGFPKGARLTHRGLVNNSRFFAQVLGVDTSDVWINPMPMFHTAGCGLVTLGALQTGGVHILPPAFDPGVMLALFEAERGTVMLSVPTMLIRMLDHPIIPTSARAISRPGAYPLLGVRRYRRNWCARRLTSTGSRLPSASDRPRRRPTSPTRCRTIPTQIGLKPSAVPCPRPR